MTREEYEKAVDRWIDRELRIKRLMKQLMESAMPEKAGKVQAFLAAIDKRQNQGQ